MKGKVRRILDVWGYYRLSTLLLLMIVLLAFAGFVCSSATAGLLRHESPAKVCRWADGPFDRKASLDMRAEDTNSAPHKIFT
jgi:hypothetical protein